MDWLNGINLTGIPWWAAFIIVLLTFFATKGVDGVLKLWTFIFDREKYYDLQKQAGEDALRKAHEDRIAALESGYAALSVKHEQTQAEHLKCQIEQEKLRGQVNLLTDKVARLEGHDKANQQHNANLKEAIKTIDPAAAVNLP